tara:strand:+ start:172 stop:633 length:462 start_codon:yes stop_codon:yes gene_type:complete
MLIPIFEKIIGILIYMLSWSEGLVFGRYLFHDYPLLNILAIPALPYIYIQQVIPFGSIILYICCFIFIIRNPKISYFIRYNMLQAILINISLIIINFIFEILLIPIGNLLLVKTFSSTIFLSLLAIIIFSIFQCLKGCEPDIPGISNSVRMQL